MRKYLLLLLCFFSLEIQAEEQKPYIVYLKPGTVLTRLSDRKNSVLEKGIYTKVLETNYKKRDLFYVYNDKNEAVYETTAKGIVEVEQDYNIHPLQVADVSYPPPSKFQTMDKTFRFESVFGLHIDNLNTLNLNNIYSDNLSSILAPRFEGRTLYTRLDYPFSLGANLNYQNASWKNDVDRVRLSILSYGPLFQYRVIEQDEITVTALVGAEFAPIYRSSSGAYKENYKALLYDVGLEGVWDTEYGKFNFGSHYRMHRLSLKSTDRPMTNPQIGQIKVKSIGFMLGYNYDWSL